jgi:hypothetical protein
VYGGAGNDTIDATGDNTGCNQLEPDCIFGGADWDTAAIDTDVWSASTEPTAQPVHAPTQTSAPHPAYRLGAVPAGGRRAS